MLTVTWEVRERFVQCGNGSTVSVSKHVFRCILISSCLKWTCSGLSPRARRNRQAIAYSPQSWPPFCCWTAGTVTAMCPLVAAFLLLQNPLRNKSQSKPFTPQPEGSIQIHHTSNHWVTSCYLDGEVKLYDFLYCRKDGIPKELEQQLRTVYQKAQLQSM